MRKSLHKKWSFPLRISSVNVPKSAENCRFVHNYWRNPQWKTSFFVQWIVNGFFSSTNFYKKSSFLNISFLLFLYENSVKWNITVFKVWFTLFSCLRHALNLLLNLAFPMCFYFLYFVFTLKRLCNTKQRIMCKKFLFQQQPNLLTKNEFKNQKLF